MCIPYSRQLFSDVNTYHFFLLIFSLFFIFFIMLFFSVYGKNRQGFSIGRTIANYTALVQIAAALFFIACACVPIIFLLYSAVLCRIWSCCVVLFHVVLCYFCFDFDLFYVAALCLLLSDHESGPRRGGREGSLPRGNDRTTGQALRKRRPAPHLAGAHGDQARPYTVGEKRTPLACYHFCRFTALPLCAVPLSCVLLPGHSWPISSPLLLKYYFLLLLK